MDFETAANTIRSRFQTQYHAARSELLAFDNLNQLVKQDGTLQIEPEDSSGNPVPWIRMSMRNAEAFQVSLGDNRTWRHAGSIICQIFVVAGTSDGLAHKIADQIAAIFRGVTVSGIRFKATSPPQFIGADGNWYQTNSITNFDYDITA